MQENENFLLKKFLISIHGTLIAYVTVDINLLKKL